jgi:hypothetical protein
MIDALNRDYDNTTAMIFGRPPMFDDLLESSRALDVAANKWTELNGAGPIENRSWL